MLSRFFLVSALLPLLITPMLQAQWRPVSPEELSLQKSKMDPGADVEGLFRDVHVLNEAATFGYPENIITEYIRLKIFTARGKDKYGTVQIPYWGKQIISDVSARTIKPDGTIVNVGKDAIFQKTITKGNGVTTKVVSFALPAVEPGAIIEYRWRENVGEFISRYLPLDVQTEFPMDEVTFHIKPVIGQWVRWPDMRYMPFGCILTRGPQESGGYSTFSAHNVPAFHEEPDMPPALSVKQWVLVYYEENDHSGTDTYWRAVGRSLYSEYSSKVKVNGDIKAIAQEQTAGAATDDEKIARLAEYCRKNLKSTNGSEMTTEERAKLKGNRTVADTLKQGEGTPYDINLAFAALAIAAGFDATEARLADRGDFLFTPNIQSEYFLHSYNIAVKINGKWKFYDFSNPNLGLGQLSWREQGVYALITDPKNPEFVTTPQLTAPESQVARIANLKLSPEGDLEGDIREIYTGNRATEWRERLSLANEAERETALRNELKRRFAEFELSNAQFHPAADPSKGVTVIYHIKVQGYTQHTAKRIFLMPAYFEAGRGPRFSEGTRQNPVYFHYPWSEFDSIEIQLPQGYQLDHADAPGSFKFGSTGSYGVKISLTNTNKLLYSRDLTFGGDGLLLFEAKQYPALKQIFDRIHEADNHILALKTEAPTAAAQIQ